MTPHYQMVIQWSEEDNCYLVHLPEFANELQYFFAHGATYEEAAKKGQEIMESLIKWYQEESKPLPQPATLQHA